MRRPIRIRRPALAAAALLAAAGCRVENAPADQQRARASAAAEGLGADAAQCEVLEKGEPLADGLAESSGLAESRTRRGIYWTHNDSGNGSDLFPISLDGRQLGRVRVEGATNRDWEDIAAGRCPAGTGECLYIADTGDNARGGGGKGQRREPFTVRLAVLPEPSPAARKARAREYQAVVPGKRTDIEALAVLPDGRVYLVSKGIRNEVELYRWPTPLAEGPPAHRLEVIERRELGPDLKTVYAISER
ncbi:MAG TPA: hypothetical protein VM890_14140 [Longimicrobium sp.]|nr:hypothetical protein [Longimicrobium sp.]